MKKYIGLSCFCFLLIINISCKKTAKNNSEIKGKWEVIDIEFHQDSLKAENLMILSLKKEILPYYFLFTDETVVYEDSSFTEVKKDKYKISGENLIIIQNGMRDSLIGKYTIFADDSMKIDFDETSILLMRKKV